MSNGSVDILIQRAEVLLSRNAGQAVALLNDALAIARKNDYKKGLAKVHYGFGMCHLQQNNYKKSLSDFNDALQLFEELCETASSIKCLDQISSIYSKLGDSPSALEYSFRSLRLYTELNDERGVANNLNVLGRIYMTLQDYEKAIEHFKRSMKIYEAKKSKKDMVNSYYLLGNAYNHTDEIEKAQYYLLRSLNSLEEIEDINVKVKTLGSLATLHTKLKEYEKALNYFHEAVDLANLGATNRVKARLNKNLGNLYLELTQYDKAIEVLQKALMIVQSLPADIQLITIHKYLATAYEKVSDFEKSLYHFRKFYEEDKRVTSEEVNLKAKSLQIRFDLEEMKKQKEIAELSDKLKEQFLANVSHEIRTPMNGILGMAHLLEQTKPTKDQQEYIDAVKLSANNLMGIINDILDFSKINAGKIEFIEREFSLRELIKGVMQILQVKAAEKGIQLSCVLDYHIKDTLAGDPIRLNQILINLMGNAVKFTENGKVTLDVRVVMEEDYSCKLRFVVIDSGIGIPQDKLDTIFESFEQANNNTKRYEGTGLGLTIVKRLVELQGGVISVKSELNHGSEFSFELSFKTPAPVKTDNATNVQSLNGGRHSTRKDEGNFHTRLSKSSAKALRILIVEDNKVNQLLVRNMLKNFGFTNFDTAENGKKALEKLHANKYDLILMDIQMPDMNGYDITREIRNNMPMPMREVPIIALTADASEKEKAMARQIGMNDYVVKPYTPEELYAAVSVYIQTETDRREEQGTENGKMENEIMESFQTFSSVNRFTFSVQILEKYTGGDNELATRLIEILLKQVPDATYKLERLIPENDWKQVHNVVHKLKGSIAVFGFQELKDLLLRMEECSSQHTDLEEIPTLFQQFKTQCRFLIPCLEKELEALKKERV